MSGSSAFSSWPFLAHSLRLLALALLLAQARRAAASAWRHFAAAATSRLSLLGIVCVGALLTSGLINSRNLLAGPRDLVATDFGRLILLKIGLFAAMVAIAAVNRFNSARGLPRRRPCAPCTATA